YARRFHDWIGENRPELSFNFSFGYSMDHPKLFEALAFLQSIGSVSGEFLQCDGLRFRHEDEIEALMQGLAASGVKHLNFTFYGTEAYHDRFAGRKGDFNYMLRLIDAAARHGLERSAGIALTHESAGQIDELLDLLTAHDMKKTSLFVPHEEGRGVSLNAIRFSQSDYDALSDRAREKLNHSRFKTEGEWIATRCFAEPENRSLIVSLMSDNIDQLEALPFDQVIARVEELDEAYYGALPGYEALAERYGDAKGLSFYGQRDLFAHYQKAYLKEMGLTPYDVTDERQSGSRRY
ncbi:MAG: hypothetical protein IJ048_09570, partial [Clostridia bacterium]|nr:hypothetical protein [Clostridia bacterium]